MGMRYIGNVTDTMERYLSTDLFKDICDDMNEEEMRIAESTPNFLMKCN